ncbi:Rap1a/Tai family immunity protein [Sphingobium yanoikuyae]|uniref:Rap1a/Tai family immunity protein n=1 Tax=Sphingobium yanoikuyae TaxID=13690 RepID=UPI003A5BEAD9
MGQILNRLVTTSVAVACLLASTAPSAASETPRFDGTELLKQCDSEEPAIAMGCWSYISGVVEGSLSTSRALGAEPILCLPEIYSERLVRENILAWIRANGRYQNLTAGALITQAMRKQYPCKRDQ